MTQVIVVLRMSHVVGHFCLFCFILCNLFGRLDLRAFFNVNVQDTKTVHLVLEKRCVFAEVVLSSKQIFLDLSFKTKVLHTLDYELFKLS